MPEITLPAEVPAPPRNPSPPPARSASAPAGPMTNIPPTITASRPSTVPPDTAPAPRTQSSLPARLPPEAEIAPIGTVSVMSGSAAPLEIPRAGQGPSVPARAFSVPQIKSLEKGAYYLQLAALSKAELVEPELARIGRTYPLVIQTVENQGRLLYRILLGPVSSGESRALLSRFKGVGYADAFIRHES
jgi:hypothetical protein